jgi:hypothetical protein
MLRPEEEKNRMFPMTLDLRFPAPGTRAEPKGAELLP